MAVAGAAAEEEAAAAAGANAGRINDQNQKGSRSIGTLSLFPCFRTRSTPNSTGRSRIA
jgi:hypothetical protein